MKVKELPSQFKDGLLIRCNERLYSDYRMTSIGDGAWLTGHATFLANNNDEVELGRFVTLEELAAKDTRIAELEAQVARLNEINIALDKQAGELIWLNTRLTLVETDAPVDGIED